MNAKLLTSEQSEALLQHGDTLPLVDPRTEKVYVLIDQTTHQKAMAALQCQQAEDEAAIQQGVDDMEAGRGMSIEESKARTEDVLSRLPQ